MVQFTQYDFLTLFYSGTGYWNHFQWVTPFGYRGITGYVLLPRAFRSLSRPSSPRSSKASTIHLYSLDHIIVSSLLPLRSPSVVQACRAGVALKSPELSFRTIQNIKTSFAFLRSLPWLCQISRKINPFYRLFSFFFFLSP